MKLHITQIDLFERNVPFIHPFRFGAVTVEAAPQAYIRVQAEVEGHGTAIGGSAELMVPKWFDKDPAKTPAQTIDDLRQSLHLAAAAYQDAQGTAFQIHAERHAAHTAACAAIGLPRLVANFGMAELDKAILDALFRAGGVGAWAGLAANLPGLDATLTPDLATPEIEAFLHHQHPAPQVPIRHAVGYLDDVSLLPATLAATGCQWVKLKLSGNPEADHARLRAIAAILPATVQGASLDANEQYDPTLLPALRTILEDPALHPITTRLLYVEQPVARGTLNLGPFAQHYPCVMDEGDDGYGAFPAALEQGWRGVSIKSCKGIYKALLNALRAQKAGAMLTAEDLTAQPGLALQQDAALVAFLALPHMERNGHAYTAGFVDADEAATFGAAHPELYCSGSLRLRTGAIPTTRIGEAIGYGAATHPDWQSLPKMNRGPRPQRVEGRALAFP